MKEFCAKCGQNYSVGDWPWCPHGDGRNFGEEPLEPYIDEHITTESNPDGSATGIEITTRGQRRKLMDANAIEYREKPVRFKSKLYFFT